MLIPPPAQIVYVVDDESVHLRRRRLILLAQDFCLNPPLDKGGRLVLEDPSKILHSGGGGSHQVIACDPPVTKSMMVNSISSPS
jgi:hypothetical protein